MQSLSMSTFFANRLGRQGEVVEKSMERLSSGKRITHSWDDAAGLSIAEGLRSQVEGTAQAGRNIQDAMNIVRIAEDGIFGMTPVLQRIREIVVHAANSANTPADRKVQQAEIDEIKSLFGQAYDAARDFRAALDGGVDADRVLEFQIGPNSGDLLKIDFNPLRSKLGKLLVDSFGYEEIFNSPFAQVLEGVLGASPPPPNTPVPPPPFFPPSPPGTTFATAFPKKLNISTGDPGDIQKAFGVVDQGLADIMSEVAYMGAIANRLEHTAAQIDGIHVNISASESQIRDTDMAMEMSMLTKSQVLQQTAQAMLTQANSRPFQVLELLRPQ